VGKSVILPLLNRKIPIIADSYVDRAFGTGVVKITPAHDFNDFQVGNRHKLQRINILNPDGTLNENAGPYQGMDRFEARKKINADLEAQGLLLKVEPHEHNVGHCYRCGTVVEPYYSKQWFVSMKPLAETALKAVAEGKTKFVPEMWRAEYERWLSGIQDWCISRQIWWGHRIPVFTCAQGHVFASAQTPTACPQCGDKKLTQDPDVLDTWFSSGLWPFSTLGWPDKTKDLATFYPTSLMVTSWDILTFWVARMMMLGLKFMGQVPFQEVYIHSLVADEEGKKMSKSKGNVVDPLITIEKYGTDALRFTLMEIETRQRYVALTPQRLESSRNFVNKLYNATRFVLMSLPKDGALRPFDNSRLTLEDRWILSRLSQTIEEVTQDYEKYRVAELAQTLYRFLWNEVCDWYLEAVKPRLYNEADPAEIKRAQGVLVAVLDAVLRLLHPCMPFVTEELWHRLPGKTTSIMKASWPKPADYPVDESAVTRFEFLKEVVTVIRTLWNELNVPLSAKVTVVVVGNKEIQENTISCQTLMQFLSRAENVNPLSQKPSGPLASSPIKNGGEVCMILEGLVDLKAEEAKKIKERQNLEKYVSSLEAELNNSQFIKNAPQSLVESKKAKLQESKDKISRIEERLKSYKN
jgi:valyl-tRNA synthetase